MSKRPEAYKAHRLHVAWVQFLTALFTLIACLRIFGIILFMPDKRARFDRVMRFWARRLLIPTGLNIKVNNPINQAFDNHERIILMVNHSSLYDIPVSFLAIPGSIRMLAKKELFRIPIFGQAMRACGMVSIDRHNREQAKKDLQNAREQLESGTVLWIAPEGTRSKDGKLHSFKKGGFYLALETEAIIIPVAICGINDVLPSNSLDLVINGEVVVNVGEAIDASEYSKDTREDLIERVHQSISHMLSRGDEYGNE